MPANTPEWELLKEIADSMDLDLNEYSGDSSPDMVQAALIERAKVFMAEHQPEPGWKRALSEKMVKTLIFNTFDCDDGLLQDVRTSSQYGYSRLVRAARHMLAGTRDPDWKERMKTSDDLRSIAPLNLAMADEDVGGPWEQKEE